MPSKRPSLVDAMMSEKIALDEKVETEQTKISSSKPSSREDKKFIGGYFAPEVSKQLKILSAKTEKSHQELVGEALNLLFDQYRENPII